uniref:Cytochrome P450 CYP3024A3 n=1 Tax=Tigriopus kingsejongensis TaxID=1133412 RepID=A0A2H4FY77_9MAXI|nr:cytochrome P450 CYP3024A3 [Tigriopus kingsejongensis]
MTIIGDCVQAIGALLAGISVTQALVAITIVLVYVYYQLTKHYGVFEKQGLFSIPPQFLFGNAKDLILQKTPMITFFRDIYEKFGNHGYGIYYDGISPTLFVKDPELIKTIAIKDFDHFTDLAFIPEQLAHLPMNEFGLANALGDEWRALKSSISPAFSLKNMKNIATSINAPALDLIESLKKVPHDEVLVEKYAGYFAMDCIGRIVFSMDFQTAKSEGNEFVRHGDNFFEVWRFALSSMLPQVSKIFNISVFNPKSVEYFLKLTAGVLNGRDKSRIQANDVLGLMMKIRDQNLTAEEAGQEHSEDDYATKKAMASQLMTNDMINRTLMQFFMDGYDTVSAVTTMSLYYLATNPEVQDKAVEEVDRIASRVGANITGEEVNELKYVDQVFQETARMAPFAFTLRRCTKDYKLQGTDATITKGMNVMFPIVALHYDPKYFPEPEHFDPERFSPENRSQIVPGSYIPFGLGPRECIGMKIAKMEAKILLYQILRNFRLEPCAQTKIPVQWRTDHFNRIEGGCYLKLVPRY